MLGVKYKIVMQTGQTMRIEVAAGIVLPTMDGPFLKPGRVKPDMADQRVRGPA